MKTKLLWLAHLTVGFFLSACSTTPIPADQAPLWKHKADVTLGVNGGEFDGVGVVDLPAPGAAIPIKLQSPVKLDVLMISTCNRDVEIDDVGHTWFGGSAKAYTYSFTPVPLERDSFCPLYFQALTSSGTVAWGYMAFRGQEKLTGQLECNGAVQSVTGLSVCQAKSGTVQAIQFSGEATFEASQLCHVTETKPGRFELTAQTGFCYASFYSGQDKHRLVLLGFDDIFMRGN